jgi:hypothetical protein
VRHTGKANAQTAHLVFADTKANAEKTKRAVFLPTPDHKIKNIIIFANN